MLLEVRWVTKCPFLVSKEILGFQSIFNQSQVSSPFEALNSRGLSRCQGMWGSLSRWGGELGFPLGSPHRIQTSLHFVMLNTSLNLRQCREIRLSFELGSLAVHSTWDRKHRVPLTYLLLRENTTWGAGIKLAQIFNQRQGISSHLRTILCAWSFPRVAVLILIFISTWDGCLRESLSIPQGSQATCTVCCGTRDS